MSHSSPLNIPDPNESGNIFSVNTGVEGGLQLQAGQQPFEHILQNLLAPINSNSFQEVIGQVKQNLIFLNQMLSLLDHTEFEGLLFNILRTVTLKIGELLNADRTTIFLLDEGQRELWSIVAQENQSKPFEIRIPDDQGIAGYVAQHGLTINIPYDFYDDPRSGTAKLLDQETGYRTYSLLTLPLINPHGKVIAVVQLLNKCRPDIAEDAPLAERIDYQGFADGDEILLKDFSDAIVLLLESYQSFYRASQKQRASAALMRATQYLCAVNSNWESTIRFVLNEAKSLICAAHTDLWLIAPGGRTLYRPLQHLADPKAAHNTISLATPILGEVALNGKSIRLNGIRSHQKLHEDLHIQQPIYNLLCLPLWSNQQKIIGVTILTNKTQRQSSEIEHAKDILRRANFDHDDEAFMAVFNRHAGLALERAQRFQEMEDEIKRRTAELEEKHQQLHAEIQERKRKEILLQELNLQLEDLVRIDALTQIDNRRHFDEQLKKEWKRMGREKLPLSLIICDVDFFKKYNDTYGHPAGDRCLYQVAQAIKNSIKRPADFVARYGGEEFVILLPNTPHEGALHLANVARKAVQTLQIPHEQSPDYQVVTLSLGVASVIPDGNDAHAEQLVQIADQGLYQAKDQGRNRAILNEDSLI